MRNILRRAWILTLLVMTSSLPFAHVGSPNVYFEGDAGQYHLLLTVNPPAMVPGIALVEARVTSGTVDSISIAPVYVNGKDQGLPPSPDVMQPSATNPRWFTGKVWLMQSGAWEIRVEVGGPKGPGRLVVPVPAYARRTLPMERDLGALLFALATYIVVAAGWRLWNRQGAEFSWPRLLVSLAATPIMWLLSRRKLRVAEALGSRALRADAVESITCGWLSFVVLIGVLAQLALGAWWVDAVTSLVIVGLLIKEGREAWHAERADE